MLAAARETQGMWGDCAPPCGIQPVDPLRQEDPRTPRPYDEWETSSFSCGNINIVRGVLLPASRLVLVLHKQEHAQFLRRSHSSLYQTLLLHLFIYVCVKNAMTPNLILISRTHTHTRVVFFVVL